MATKKDPVKQPEPITAPKQKDPLADANAAFEAALAKTKAESVEVDEKAHEEPIVFEEPEEKPQAKKPKAEAKKKEPDEMAKLRSEFAELRKASQPAPKPEPEVEPEDFQEVAAALAERFGEEEGEALSEAMRRLVAPREERLRKIEKLLEEGMKRGRIQTVKTNRSRLGEAYPRLKESDQAWQAIEAQANKLFASDPDRFTTIEEAYDATVQEIYGEPQRSELPSEEDEEEVSRIAASTPTPPGRQKREQKMTAEQASMAVFKHLYKNPEDVSGAKRLAHTLRVSK